jgi:uroporphyrinogen decarboxylase
MAAAELLLLKALRGKPCERPPVWLMRQAGRYMHEYQAVRQRASFLAICKTPELAVEVTLQPIDAFDMDAAIVFSDILIPLEAMGLALEVTDAKGPVFTNPLRSPEALSRLQRFDPNEATPFLADALRTLQPLMHQRNKALLGFVGCPWTLATYAIEGTSWKTGQATKQWLYAAPEALHQLLGLLTEQLIVYANAQLAAGADAIQLFDTWAAQVPGPYYEAVVFQYQQRLIEGIKAQHPTAPVILFVKQSRGLWPWLVRTHADALSVDEWTPLHEARAHTQAAGADHLVLQGNLDSSLLFVEDTALFDGYVNAMLRQGGHQRYVANLGHGVLPKTPRANVERFVNLVKQSATH